MLSTKYSLKMTNQDRIIFFCDQPHLAVTELGIIQYLVEDILYSIHHFARGLFSQNFVYI